MNADLKVSATFDRMFVAGADFVLVGLCVAPTVETLQPKTLNAVSAPSPYTLTKCLIMFPGRVTVSGLANTHR